MHEQNPITHTLEHEFVTITEFFPGKTLHFFVPPQDSRGILSEQTLQQVARVSMEAKQSLVQAKQNRMRAMHDNLSLEQAQLIVAVINAEEAALQPVTILPSPPVGADEIKHTPPSNPEDRQEFERLQELYKKTEQHIQQGEVLHDEINAALDDDQEASSDIISSTIRTKSQAEGDLDRLDDALNAASEDEEDSPATTLVGLTKSSVAAQALMFTEHSSLAIDSDFLNNVEVGKILSPDEASLVSALGNIQLSIGLNMQDLILAIIAEKQLEIAQDLQTLTANTSTASLGNHRVQINIVLPIHPKTIEPLISQFPDSFPLLRRLANDHLSHSPKIAYRKIFGISRP